MIRLSCTCAGVIDVATPAPYAQRTTSPPDSAISTGDRVLLPPPSAGVAARRRKPLPTSPGLVSAALVL